MANNQELTNGMIERLRAKGREVIDLRGKLPVNDNPALRYRDLPGGLAACRYILVHWTGDRFERAFWNNLLGMDYGVDVINPFMSVAQEIKLLEWYANYHIRNDGGMWGGIAYGTLVMPSGRIYVAWNVGTRTYHAFAANNVSYALSCPIANSAQPTLMQAGGLVDVITDLCENMPDLPAGRSNVYGHTEAKFIDAQNRTTCPGTLLPLVQAYRAGQDVSQWIGISDQVDENTLSDQELAAHAVANALGDCIGTASINKPYAHGKLARYTGGSVTCWEGPGRIKDITGYLLDDGMSVNENAGLIVKNGAW